MVGKIRTAPRKAPAQERSRVMVEAILTATARVLLRVGYDRCSTNLVAREAGVSVGSLYQYFPSKEAVVVALAEREMAAVEAELTPRMAALADAPLEDLAGEMLEAMVAIYRRNPRLQRVLLEEVPRIGALERLESLNARFERMVTDWLEANRSRVEVDEPSLVAWGLVTAIAAITHRALRERPELLASGRLEEQVLRLALSYVAPSLVARARRERRPLGKLPRARPAP